MARFNLPEIEFVPVDAVEIETSIVGRFEELSGIKLSEADPRRKFIQSLVYGFTLQLNNIDFTAKQNRLAYAVDDFLDHFGENKSVSRIEPKSSITVIRFEVNPVETSVIPAGTRISINEIFFETTSVATVEPGMQFVDVAAVCTEAGTKGNGYLPGQINNLVDPLPWVSKAYNTVLTVEGSDWEDDDSYAERIRQSNERFSTAGPTGAYEFFAKSANQLIVDVFVHSPSDGVIEIRPLLKGGDIPSADVLGQVLNIVDNRNVRPLTDKVNVLAPEVIEYDIDVTYFVSKENESILTSIQSTVQSAVNEYTLWQKSKLGRGIDASELISKVKNAGAKRVAVTLPASYTPIESYQVARDRLVNVTFGGVVND